LLKADGCEFLINSNNLLECIKYRILFVCNSIFDVFFYRVSEFKMYFPTLTVSSYNYTNTIAPKMINYKKDIAGR